MDRVLEQYVEAKKLGRCPFNTINCRFSSCENLYTILNLIVTFLTQQLLTQLHVKLKQDSLSIGHIDEFHYVSTVPAVPNTEQVVCDNSVSTDLAFGACKTEKTVNTQSGELRKQTCVNSQENYNTYLKQLTRQGRSVVKV